MIIQANPDEDEAGLKYPSMQLAQQIHKLSMLPSERRLDLETEVFTTIATELKNPSLYRLVRDKLYPDNGMVSTAVQLQEADLESLAKENAAHRTTLLEAKATATESAGDTEVMDAQVAIAQFSAKSLDTTQAVADYRQILELPKVSTSKQMDAWMAIARIHSFYGNVAETDTALEELQQLIAAGSDWDRRNRAAVYKAMQQLLHRDFAAAAKPLLAGVATFNCTELCSYQDFIVYGILTNLLHLPRQDLKSKIMDGPEILSLAKDIPIVVRWCAY